jgi:hypothetical protein
MTFFTFIDLENMRNLGTGSSLSDSTVNRYRLAVAENDYAQSLDQDFSVTGRPAVTFEDSSWAFVPAVSLYQIFDAMDHKDYALEIDLAALSKSSILETAYTFPIRQRLKAKYPGIFPFNKFVTGLTHPFNVMLQYLKPNTVDVNGDYGVSAIDSWLTLISGDVWITTPDLTSVIFEKVYAPVLGILEEVSKE